MSTSNNRRDRPGAPDEVYRKIKNETGYSSVGPHSQYSGSTVDSAGMDEMFYSYEHENAEEQNWLASSVGGPKRSHYGELSMAKGNSSDSYSKAEALDDEDEEDDELGSYADTIEDLPPSKSGDEHDDRLASILLNPKKAAKQRKSSTERIKTVGEKLTAKEKNREHAKNTRIRKKNYVESLKESIRTLTEEREKIDRDRKIAVSRLTEQASVRKKVLQEAMQNRCQGMLDRTVWRTLLEDSIELVLPITPYRSFPPGEVCNGERRVHGIDAVILDVASVSVMLMCIKPSFVENIQLQMVCKCDYADAVLSEDALMCRWEARTVNAIQAGCAQDILIHGILWATFSAYNKLQYLELSFDVMSCMQQLRRSSGRSDFSIIPNTYPLALESVNDARVITECVPPFRIVHVSSGWEELFGYNENEVLGQSCRFLQGDQTDPVRVAGLMRFVHSCLPCATIVKNYHKNGDCFGNWLRIYPLYEDSTISHYLGIMERILENLEHHLVPGSDYRLSRHPVKIDAAPMGVSSLTANNLDTLPDTTSLSSISMAYRAAQAEKLKKEGFAVSAGYQPSGLLHINVAPHSFSSKTNSTTSSSVSAVEARPITSQRSRFDGARIKSEMDYAYGPNVNSNAISRNMQGYQQNIAIQQAVYPCGKLTLGSSQSIANNLAHQSSSMEQTGKGIGGDGMHGRADGSVPLFARVGTEGQTGQQESDGSDGSDEFLYGLLNDFGHSKQQSINGEMDGLDAPGNAGVSTAESDDASIADNYDMEMEVAENAFGVAPLDRTDLSNPQEAPRSITKHHKNAIDHATALMPSSELLHVFSSPNLQQSEERTQEPDERQ